MGDRTTVRITITESNYKKLLERDFNSDPEKFSGEVYSDDRNDFKNEETGVNLVEFTGHDMNYGDWRDLEGILKDNLIEYDKSWDSGCGYEAGEAYFRLKDGALVEHSFYNSVTVEIDLLKSLLEHKGDLREEIQKKLKHLEPEEIKPLSDSNSLDFIRKEA